MSHKNTDRLKCFIGDEAYNPARANLFSCENNYTLANMAALILYYPDLVSDSDLFLSVLSVCFEYIILTRSIKISPYHFSCSMF